MAGQQKQGRCIFCGGVHLSKEHIISDWIGSLFPKAKEHWQATDSIVFDAATNSVWNIPLQLRRKQGDPRSRKVRNVCKRCNSGWMSGIVNRSKPFLASAIFGEPLQINRKTQRDVAAWIALTAIINEFTDVRSATIPEEDRKHVRANEQPPDDWTISIGRYAGGQWAEGGVRYRHHGYRFTETGLPGRVGVNRAAKHQYQLTTMVIGALAFQCFSSTSKQVSSDFRNKFIPSAMIALWPSSDDIAWPCAPLIGDDGMHQISERFRYNFNRPGSR